MIVRTWLSLLALAGAAQAQLSGLLWPPRDIGSREIFGYIGCVQDGRLLAVNCYRDLENPMVRVYVREGLNWIEEDRLTIAPRTPLDYDQGLRGIDRPRRRAHPRRRGRGAPVPAHPRPRVDARRDSLSAAARDR